MGTVPYMTRSAKVISEMIPRMCLFIRPCRCEATAHMLTGYRHVVGYRVSKEGSIFGY